MSGQKHRPLVRAVEMVIDIRLMRRRHRRDGEVDDREELAEEHAISDLLMFLDDSAENEQIGRAIDQNGLESPWAQRLIGQRRRRRARLLVVAREGADLDAVLGTVPADPDPAPRAA